MTDKKKAFNRDKIKEAIRNDIIDAYHQRNKLPDFYSNTIDIFGAAIDSKLLRINLDEWRKIEEPRQTQKTVQNIFGRLHQTIIGTVDDWEDLGKGQIVDVKNDKKKIIAEIKNKHNTVTGGLRKTPYDTLKKCLKTEYRGYTSYFVEILPKNRNEYDKPFVPSDNTKKLNKKDKDSNRRPENKKIRLIDGKSFYELVTGEKDAIKELYELLPVIIDEILVEEGIIDKKDEYELDDALTKEFYSKTYL